jgi:hypothetical protein
VEKRPEPAGHFSTDVENIVDIEGGERPVRGEKPPFFGRFLGGTTLWRGVREAKASKSLYPLRLG